MKRARCAQNMNSSRSSLLDFDADPGKLNVRRKSPFLLCSPRWGLLQIRHYTYEFFNYYKRVVVRMFIRMNLGNNEVVHVFKHSCVLYTRVKDNLKAILLIFSHVLVLFLYVSFYPSNSTAFLTLE